MTGDILQNGFQHSIILGNSLLDIHKVKAWNTKQPNNERSICNEFYDVSIESLLQVNP